MKLDDEQRCPELEQHLACSGLLADADQDRITLVGLIFETAVGLRRSLGATLDPNLGVTGAAFDILLRLYRSPGTMLRMSDLAAQTGFTPSGLTRAIDRLVEAGLIERLSCPSDRRGAFAVLTELGHTRTNAAVERHLCDIDELLGGVLDPEDEALLVGLLRALRDRVQPDAALVTSGLEAHAPS